MIEGRRKDGTNAIRPRTKTVVHRGIRPIRLLLAAWRPGEAAVQGLGRPESLYATRCGVVIVPCLPSWASQRLERVPSLRTCPSSVPCRPESVRPLSQYMQITGPCHSFDLSQHRARPSWASLLDDPLPRRALAAPTHNFFVVSGHRPGSAIANAPHAPPSKESGSDILKPIGSNPAAPVCIPHHDPANLDATHTSVTPSWEICKACDHGSKIKVIV